ncbi:VOC family protein [Agromyces sp. NPDC049794]|uniref:VOC family protein n=1 Tax=unclassified Agromyces TaxID=2639701 RepID=UPI00341080E3
MSTDPTDLEVSTMNDSKNSIQRAVTILVYRNPGSAHDYLTEVFGFTPGKVTLDADSNAVHAEVVVGDVTIWLHPENDKYELASPQNIGAAAVTMAVFVDDVDEHYRLANEKGARIVSEPLDQPYGYREYSARDCEGFLWSFMKEITP